MAKQYVSIVQIIQNIKQYSINTVDENRKSCLQNNLLQEKIEQVFVKPEEEQKCDVPKEPLKIQQVVKQICLSDGNTKTPTLIKLIRTDEQLIYYTGVNFYVLKSITESALVIEMNDKDPNKKDSTFESIRNRIVLCLSKLRRNYSFQLLALLFGISEEECIKDFIYTITTLYKIVTKSIYLPSESDTLEILSDCSTTMLNLQFVLHYIEFSIRKARTCKKCNFCTHSQDMVCKNLKFIFAVAPIGLITFVSKTFGGFTPVKVIMNESNLFDRIDLNKHAIVIKKLTDELSEFDEKVNVDEKETSQTPDEKQVDKTFGKQDDETEVCVKKKSFKDEFVECREFINETIERFSEFRILKGTLPLELYFCIDEIIAVIAGLINLQDE